MNLLHQRLITGKSLLQKSRFLLQAMLVGLVAQFIGIAFDIDAVWFGGFVMALLSVGINWVYFEPKIHENKGFLDAAYWILEHQGLFKDNVAENKTGKIQQQKDAV